MRGSILLWSTASGLILGLFLDATLIGVALLFSAVSPTLTGRLHQRWLIILAVVILTGIPLVMSILGYLEGELKAV